MCFLPFCCRALTGLLFVGALLSLVDLVEAAPFTPVQNRVEVIVASGFDPVPIDVGLVPDAEGFDFTAMKAVSDRAWVVPTVQGGQGAGHLQLVFVGAADLVTSNTATVTLTHGSEVRSVFVQALVSALSLATLLDDPGRSRMYGLHRPGPGLKRGSVVALDPLSGQPLGSQSLGRRPTDLAMSADGTELLVLNAADKSVTVMEAATLRVKEMIHPAQQTFPSENYTITPDGEVVATAGALYEGASGLKLAEVPNTGGVQAITSD